MENFEQSKAHEALAKAYSTMPVGEPSIHIKMNRKAMDEKSFRNEYQCEFKSGVEIMHYDDTSADIQSKIYVNEFGNDRGYIVDCVVMNFRNGNPSVSYYANLGDFAGHPKWNYKECFVVCFDERYKLDNKSETK